MIMTQTPATADSMPEELIALLIHQHRTSGRPMFQRLWDYYRNELDYSEPDDHRPYRTAQEQGLPRRLTRRPGGSAQRTAGDASRREVVIENDIAWRVHTLVDFMFGKPVSIQSLADNRELAGLIEKVLNQVFDANGGPAFFQDMALLGSVYGFVDLLLRVDRLPISAAEGLVRPTDSSTSSTADRSRAPSKPIQPRRVLRYASHLILETVEAPRSIPVLSPDDYRQLDAYMLDYTQQLNEVDCSSFLGRLLSSDGVSRGRLATAQMTELWDDRSVRCYRDQQLIRESPNILGRLPLVHIQNLPQPFFYEGLSEVEPLIPLQDELNTRLSDRANRVTFQSFKMYLGKGIENFLERPVGPGQMWTTDNPDAAIETFGGDGPSPSEDAHINEIREAMDKTSTVTPLAAGLLRNRVGNLTSENALRVVMMGLLNRTEKKRITYGQGISQLCELILHALDVTGVLPNRPEDRRIKLHWPSPLPENQDRRLREAQMKLQIGVPRQQVLAELGYQEDEASAAAGTR
jgi:hypothetical protein